MTNERYVAHWNSGTATHSPKVRTRNRGRLTSSQLFIKISIIISAIGCSVSVMATDELIISGFFEHNDAPGKFTYGNNADKTGLHIEYDSPSLNRKLTYDVAK